MKRSYVEVDSLIGFLFRDDIDKAVWNRPVQYSYRGRGTLCFRRTPALMAFYLQLAASFFFVFLLQYGTPSPIKKMLVSK